MSVIKAGRSVNQCCIYTLWAERYTACIWVHVPIRVNVQEEVNPTVQLPRSTSELAFMSQTRLAVLSWASE